jgi:hypothetical protein
MTVSRLLTLLMIFAFLIANGPAVAMAMCQHEDPRAHAAALQSLEAEISVVAQSEEAAATAASKKGSLNEAATTLLAGYILPGDPPSFPRRFVEPAAAHLADSSRMGSRSVPPLLEPPLV